MTPSNSKFPAGSITFDRQDADEILHHVASAIYYEAGFYSASPVLRKLAIRRLRALCVYFAEVAYSDFDGAFGDTFSDVTDSTDIDQLLGWLSDDLQDLFSEACEASGEGSPAERDFSKSISRLTTRFDAWRKRQAEARQSEAA